MTAATRPSAFTDRFPKTLSQLGLDLPGIAILTVGTDGQLTAVNDHACQLFQCEKANLLGQNWIGQLVVETSQTEARHRFDNLLRGHALKSLDLPTLTPSGERRHLLFHGHLLSDSSGQTTSVLLVGIDVTEQHHAKEALRQANGELRRAHEELELRVVARTAELAELNESLTEEIQRREHVQRELKTAHDHCEAKVRERTAALTESNERLRREISERQQAQEALRDREQRYRNMFDAAGVALFEADMSRVRDMLTSLAEQGAVADFGSYLRLHPERIVEAVDSVRIRDVNSMAMRIYRAPQKQQLLCPLRNYFTAQSFHTFGHLLQAMWDGKRFFEAEGANLTVEGAPVDILLRITLPETQEQWHHVVVSIVDVTEHKLRRIFVKKILAAQEEERRRMARELHDETGQALTSAIIRLQEIQGAATLETARDLSARTQSIVEQSLDEIGRLARGLHPYVLDDLGFAEALRRHVSECAEINGLYVGLELLGLENGDPPQALATTLYRVVQEALTNIVKHAAATRVSILMRWSPQRVRTVIEDDGAGFNSNVLSHPTPASGLGLQGIRERVSLLGGQVEIESSPGEGTTLVVDIPVS